MNSSKLQEQLYQKQKYGFWIFPYFQYVIMIFFSKGLSIILKKTSEITFWVSSRMVIIDCVICWCFFLYCVPHNRTIVWFVQTLSTIICMCDGLTIFPILWLEMLIWVYLKFLFLMLLILIVSSSTQVSMKNIESDEAIDHEELLDKENYQFQKQSSFFVDSAIIGRMVHFHVDCYFIFLVLQMFCNHTWGGVLVYGLEIKFTILY